MKTILLIYGGRSVEHDISCLSACQVYTKLLDIGYHVKLIGVSSDGRFYYQRKPLMHHHKLVIEEDISMNVSVIPGVGFSIGTTAITADVVFPLIHGTYGEDGTLQGMLELIGIPYIGSNQIASGICMKKSFAKALLAHAHLPITPYCLVNLHQRKRTEQALKLFIAQQGFPLFVKPDIGGSSVGITKVLDHKELARAFELAGRYDSTALVERFIDADEIECGVCGSDEDLHVSLPAGIFPEDEFYSYEAKYGKDGFQVQIPPEISDEHISLIQDLAKKAYTTLSCSGFARVDFFYTKKDHTLVINEINTIPGLTPHSMFMNMFIASGFDWEDFFCCVILDAVERSAQSASQDYCLDSNTILTHEEIG